MSNIISNLASSTPRIFAFKDSDLNLKLRFPDNYSLSGLSSKIYYNGRFREGIATTTYSGSLATITITKENIALIPLSVFTLFIYNGSSVLTSTTIEVRFTGDHVTNDTINVTISDGIDIELSFSDSGKNLEYSERAEAAANDAETFKNSAQTFATNASNSATTATQQATISTNKASESLSSANTSTTQAGLSNTARIASEAARDQVLAYNTSVTVSTYANAVPLFTGSLFKRIDVISDSVYNLDDDPTSPTYNQGLPSFYTYNPALPSGKRVAFLGLDPDYLTNV